MLTNFHKTRQLSLGSSKGAESNYSDIDALRV